MTPNTDFKVHYDYNLTRSISEMVHSYNAVFIETYTCPAQGCHFDWTWV